MKVLHVIPCLAGGGAERQLQYLSNSQTMGEFEVHVAYIYDGGLDIEAYGNVTLHRLNARSNYDPQLLFGLYSLIKKINPDIVQSWLIQSDILSAIVCSLTRRKWVVRESNAPALRTGNDLKFYLRKQLIRFAAAIISNSQAGLSYWEKVYSKNRNVLIENGFPTTEIQKESEDSLPAGLRDELGDYVLFVGRLESQKNIEKILESMVLVDSRLNLVLCGSGKLEASLKQLVCELGIGNRVVFKGKTDKSVVYQLMRNARGVVLNSHFEGFPNVAVEAMICRAPLVVSDIPPHRAILNDNSASFVDKENESALAEAIDGLLNDPVAARNKAENAYTKAQGLSLESMAEKYRQLYVALR